METLPSFSPGNKDLRRLCIHTITTKPWPIHTAIQKYQAAGIGGISVWRDAVAGHNLESIRKDLISANLRPVSLVRGGFFTSGEESKRREAIEENKRAIDECAAIGAPMVVLVCGATPGLNIRTNLDQIRDGIVALLDHAEKCGVKLAIEPLHPMYADTRSAVTTLKSANDLWDEIQSNSVGVAVDVFHTWWDPEFETQLKRCGNSGNLLAYHLCDWKPNMQDMLNDRGLMGEGIIDLKRMTGQVENAGFSGYHEVEIFSTIWWGQDQDQFLNAILRAYTQFC